MKNDYVDIREGDAEVQSIVIRRLPAPANYTVQQFLYLVPPLNELLSPPGFPSVNPVFEKHQINEMWFPIPKQTLRNVFVDTESATTFFNSQKELLGKHPSISLVWQFLFQRVPVHATLEDADDHVTAKRILGEGGFSTVEEVVLSLGREAVVCVRKKIGRPRQLKQHKQVMAAFGREMNVMRQVRHRHCVEFLGSYTDLDSVNILSLPVADMDLAKLLDLPLSSDHRQILISSIDCLSNAM